MTKTIQFAIVAFAAFLPIAMVGCADSAATATVSGHVTIEGALLSGGTVVFHPVESGKIAYGPIQSDGSYALHIGRGEKGKAGLLPGEYDVVVSSHLAPVEGIGKRGGPPDPGTLVTPPRYLDPNKTPLHFRVADGAQVIDLKLEWTEEDKEKARKAGPAVSPSSPPARPDESAAELAGATEEGTEEATNSDTEKPSNGDAPDEGSENEGEANDAQDGSEDNGANRADANSDSP